MAIGAEAVEAGLVVLVGIGIGHTVAVSLDFEL
jgi:hypothetical protein